MTVSVTHHWKTGKGSKSLLGSTGTDPKIALLQQITNGVSPGGKLRDEPVPVLGFLSLVAALHLNFSAF